MLSVAVIKHNDQKIKTKQKTSCGEESSWLTDYRPSSEEDDEAGAEAEVTGHTLLTSVFFMAPSACFLYNLGSMCKSWYHPQWVRPSHIKHQSRKCPTGLPTNNLNEGIVFN